MAEGDEAEAAHERPRPPDEGPDEDLDEDVDQIFPHAAQRQEGLHGEEGHHQSAEEAGPAHVRFAKMPPGRTNMSTMKMTKATT